MRHDKRTHLFIISSNGNRSNLYFTSEHTLNNSDWTARIEAAIVFISVTFASFWILKIAYDFAINFVELKK